jgi:ketosteroid isomerase-like protein
MRKFILLALLFSPALLAGDADVATALDAFHAAAARGDREAYFALMTDDVVFLGTDASERWQGQSFRDFVREHFSGGRGWTYTPTERHIDMAQGGGWALFDELLQHDRLGQCRGSGVLVLEEGSWKIAQYNLSVPVPNDIVVDVANRIRAMAAPDG